MVAPKPQSSCHLTLSYAYNSYTKKGEAIKSYTIHSNGNRNIKFFHPTMAVLLAMNIFILVFRDIYSDVRDIYLEY